MPQPFYSIENDIHCFTLKENYLILSGVHSVEETILPIIKDETTHKVILNLQKINVMDSSGIGMLTNIFNTIHDRKGRFALCNVSEKILSIISLVGLASIFEIYVNLEESLIALNE